jgi:hypothetical protein
MDASILHGIHGATIQKAATFILAAVRISNPTKYSFPNKLNENIHTLDENRTPTNVLIY